jgi:hypothetical protein
MIVTYNRLDVPRKPGFTLPGVPSLAKIWPTMNGACQPALAQALAVTIREAPVRVPEKSPPQAVVDLEAREAGGPNTFACLTT